MTTIVFVSSASAIMTSIVSFVVLIKLLSSLDKEIEEKI